MRANLGAWAAPTWTRGPSQGPLDRCLRDILTANQHVIAAARTYEMAGRLPLGLEPLPVVVLIVG